MSEPKIFTKNYVNSDDTFVVSSGSAAIANAYDRDKLSQWSSSGANSDSTPVTIEVDFFEGTVAIARTFDTIILINHNLKNYTVDYWNGTAWVNIITTTADVTPVATLYNSFGSIGATKIRIVMNSTQTANLEKVIGEIVCAALQLDMGIDLSTYSVTYRQKVKSLLMGDGSMHQALVFWSPYRSEKYEAKVGFENLSLSNVASLAAIKEAGAPFLWYPESSTRPDDIYFVHWANPLTWKYSSLYKTSGVDVSLDFKEI